MSMYFFPSRNFRQFHLSIWSVFVFVAILLRTINNCVWGLYDDGDEGTTFVKRIESSSVVLDSDQIWMIQLYDPNHDEAKEFAPMYGAVAKLMRGLFAFGVIDITKDGTVAKQLSMKKPSKIPMVYIMGDDKKKPIKVSRDNIRLDAQKLAEALMQHASKTIQDRSQSLGPQQQQSSSSGRKKKSDKSHIIMLNSSNFDSYVYNNPDIIAIAFTAPWCGHCKSLLPEWEDAATRLIGSGAVLGWIDSTIDKDIAQQYGVTGYPTIKIFPGGLNKKQTDAKDYKNERSASAIVQYMLKVVDKTSIPPPIPQLINDEMLHEACGSHNRICILAALPHILDSGAVTREKYRDILSTVGKKYRGNTAFTFFWFEYTSQPILEQTLELTFGSPAIAALSIDRKAYVVYRSSFNEKGISTFLKGITSGREIIIPLPNNGDIPKVITTTLWDGKDGEILEDEIPLSDIMGDDEL